MGVVMSYVSKLLCVFALFSAQVGAAESEEIDVLLKTDQALLPTHVESIEPKEASFSQDYLSQLRAILSSDINNNGMMSVLEGRDRKKAEEAIGKLSYEGSIDLSNLRSMNVSYIVRWKMATNDLSVKVVEVTAGTVRTIQPVRCSGELSKDRNTMHQLADCIFQMLFGKPGIANTKILYVSKHDGKSEVFESDYDGRGAHPVTQTHSLCVTPLWIPSREKGQKSRSFLYVSYQLGQPKLYMASLSGGPAIKVCSMRGNQLTPAINADGSMIAFCSDITGTADLYIVSFEEGVGAVGKPRQIFHARGTATGCPSFSPDGKKIAFVSNKDGSPRIYIMDIPPPGTKSTDLKPTLISKRCRENTAPCWSPDGKKIAYSAKNSGNRQIWVYDIEQKTEQEITSGSGSKESPSWAPDNFHLVYHAYYDSVCSVYVTSLHHATPVKVAEGGEKLFASWEPFRR
jgi:TolB protein